MAAHKAMYEDAAQKGDELSAPKERDRRDS
jgi:hypothetical protein